ncbi:MAG: type II toxin-antitoxin system RelE/ParE family toxin [Paracoccaceae bacterium]
MTGADWRVVFAAQAVHDLALIEEHLIRSYRDCGESRSEALRHAEVRVEGLIATAERLATAPFRGEAREDVLPALRHLALDNAIFWFIPDPDVHEIRVLAVFFGAQDHQRHMLVRLLQKGAR